MVKPLGNRALLLVQGSLQFVNTGTLGLDFFLGVLFGIKEGVCQLPR